MEDIMPSLAFRFLGKSNQVEQAEGARNGDVIYNTSGYNKVYCDGEWINLCSPEPNIEEEEEK